MDFFDSMHNTFRQRHCERGLTARACGYLLHMDALDLDQYTCDTLQDCSMWVHACDLVVHLVRPTWLATDLQ